MEATLMDMNLVGVVLGWVGGVVGTYFSIKNSAGPLQRAFMIRVSVIGWIAISAFIIAMRLLPHPFNWLLWIPYCVALPWGIVRANRRLIQIRAEEGFESQSASGGCLGASRFLRGGDTGRDPSPSARNYRGAFIGITFGSVAWMGTLLFEIRNEPMAGRLSLWIVGCLATALILDLWIWNMFSRRAIMTKWTFFGAIAGVSLTASLAAVFLELVCQPLLIHSDLRTASFLWVPAIAGIALVYVAFQFSLTHKIRREKEE